MTPVDSLKELERLVEAWDGSYPTPGCWQTAEVKAREIAAQRVRLREQQASERANEMIRRQMEAARLRLRREVGLYLVCLSNGSQDLNAVLHQQMSRDIASAQRLRQCLERLGGYPEWPAGLLRELESYVQDLSENQRRARLLGSEIDAALQDPRWAAEGVPPQSQVHGTESCRLPKS